MANTTSFKFLAGVSLRELAFLCARFLHLDYSRMGRFSEVEVSSEEVERLAQLHQFYWECVPVPATVIHGIAPRSGTNYVLDLMRAHPDVSFLPEALPEIPFLSIARDSMALQEQFLQRYDGNQRSMGTLDFLSHITHGSMLWPHSKKGSKSALFKVPHVHHLNLFPVIHPSYRIIICVRDGRDVVASSCKTWAWRGVGRRSFKDYTREWARSARIIQDAIKKFDAQGFPYRLVRYEDAFLRPLETARSLVGFMGLDPDKLDESHYEKMRVRGSSEGSEKGRVDWKHDNIVRDTSFKPIGRWHSWTDRRKRLFCKIAGQELTMFGYE